MVVDKETTKIRRMFAAISPRYDLLNHLLSFNIDKQWRRRVVRELDLPAGARVLDICTGTADLALELTRAVDASRGGRVYGTDFTTEMVHLGAAKRRRRRLAQPFLGVADSLSLPFPAEQFDAVTVAFGIRNVSDLERCLREMWRVLKPGGQAAILDFSLPRARLIRGAYRVYFHSLLPRVGAWISRTQAGADAYRYLPESVSEFPAPERFTEVLRENWFEDARFHRLACGIAVLHLARRPVTARPDASEDENPSAPAEAGTSTGQMRTHR